jgi:hypothetical protein
VPESYPSPADRSSPTPPELPERPPERFQFSLAMLLLVTFVCAIGAAGIRWSGAPSDVQLLGFVVTAIFIAYTTFRWAAAWRRFDRWGEIQQHRQELEEWARHRKRDKG